MKRWTPCAKTEGCCLEELHDGVCASAGRVLADFAAAWLGRAVSFLRRRTPR